MTSGSRPRDNRACQLKARARSRAAGWRSRWWAQSVSSPAAARAARRWQPPRRRTRTPSPTPLRHFAPAFGLLGEFGRRRRTHSGGGGVKTSLADASSALAMAARLLERNAVVAMVNLLERRGLRPSITINDEVVFHSAPACVETLTRELADAIRERLGFPMTFCIAPVGA